MPGAPTTRVPVIAAVAAVVPAAPALLAAVWIIIGWVLGANPFWPVPEVNVAEAAAVRDHAEVVRLIEAGQNPNQKWRVRMDLLDSREHLITPLEAAISIRRLELVQLLVRHGAEVSPATRPGLIERATAVNAPDIVAYLQQPEPVSQ